jgi:hypothetical protein
VASRKQRRRREKEKRHEYELVEIDAEGNETVLNAAELKSPPPRASKSRGETAKPSRGGRTIQPPSWTRVLKRGLIFAPLFFLTVMLLGGSNVSIVGALLQTVLLMAVFVPFSYFMDRLVWRSQQKRLARTSGRS